MHLEESWARRCKQSLQVINSLLPIRPKMRLTVWVDMILSKSSLLKAIYTLDLATEIVYHLQKFDFKYSRMAYISADLLNKCSQLKRHLLIVDHYMIILCLPLSANQNWPLRCNCAFCGRYDEPQLPTHQTLFMTIMGATISGRWDVHSGIEQPDMGLPKGNSSQSFSSNTWN